MLSIDMYRLLFISIHLYSSVLSCVDMYRLLLLSIDLHSSVFVCVDLFFCHRLFIASFFFMQASSYFSELRAICSRAIKKAILTALLSVSNSSLSVAYLNIALKRAPASSSLSILRYVAISGCNSIAFAFIGFSFI